MFALLFTTLGCLALGSALTLFSLGSKDKHLPNGPGAFGRFMEALGTALVAGAVFICSTALFLLTSLLYFLWPSSDPSNISAAGASGVFEVVKAFENKVLQAGVELSPLQLCTVLFHDTSACASLEQQECGLACNLIQFVFVASVLLFEGVPVAYRCVFVCTVIVLELAK